jgi:DNA-3-methyladenine glycosylase II
MKTFSLPLPPGFSLAAATSFYAGFTPGSGMAAAAIDTLTLAFRVDRSFEAVAVSLEERDGVLVAEMAGSEGAEEAVRAQLGRMLGLEADATAWQSLGERVPLVGALKAEFPGFFTAAKASPYDAAVWSVIVPRMSMTMAARIKMDIARTHGTAVELRGRTHQVFPAPQELLGLEHAPGLSDEKVTRLHGVARAALDGLLDSESLRAMGEARALAQLQSLRGVGPWSASHIYYRGAAPIDALPLTEPRVFHGLAQLTGEAVPDAAAFLREAESWRPFRMWVAVLLSRHLATTDGWRAPTLGKERAAAGRALARKTRLQPRALPLPL